MIHFLFRRRTALFWIAPVVLLLVARPTPGSVAAGVPLVVAGQLLRIWASGYLSKLSKLITAGPYALCRNPMYVGTFLICLGYFVMCNRPLAWVVGLVFFGAFHMGAVLYEERLLKEKFSKEFDDYCRRVPRFMPRLRRPSGHGTFSWGQLVLNNEHYGAAGTLIMAALFALSAYSTSHAPLGWLASIQP